MANKSVVAVVVLFCVAGIIEVQAWSERIGGGSISTDGVWGKKDDFYYHVPPRAAAVTLSKTDSSSGGVSLIGATGKATVSWTKGSRTAKVHAWVNGRFCVKTWWNKCHGNRISWTVYAHF